jgi:hypothetical protein
VKIIKHESLSIEQQSGISLILLHLPLWKIRMRNDTCISNTPLSLLQALQFKLTQMLRNWRLLHRDSELPVMDQRIGKFEQKDETPLMFGWL